MGQDMLSVNFQRTMINAFFLAFVVFSSNAFSESIDELEHNYLLRKTHLGPYHSETMDAGKAYISALLQKGQIDQAMQEAEGFYREARKGSRRRGYEEALDLLVFRRELLLPLTLQKINLKREIQTASFHFGPKSVEYALHLNSMLDNVTQVLEEQYPVSPPSPNPLSAIKKVSKNVEKNRSLVRQVAKMSEILRILASQNSDVKLNAAGLFYEGINSILQKRSHHARQVFSLLQQASGGSPVHKRWADLLLKQLEDPANSANKELHSLAEFPRSANTGVNRAYTFYLRERQFGSLESSFGVHMFPMNPAYLVLAKRNNLEYELTKKGLQDLERAVSLLLKSDEAGESSQEYFDALASYVDVLCSLPTLNLDDNNSPEKNIFQDHNNRRTLYAHRLLDLAIPRIESFIELYPVMSNVNVGNRLQHLVFTLGVYELLQGNESKANLAMISLLTQYHLEKSNSKYVGYAMNYLIAKAELYQDKAREAEFRARASELGIDITPVGNPLDFWREEEVLDLNEVAVGLEPVIAQSLFWD